MRLDRLNRRDFLKTGSLLASASVFPPQLLALGAPDPLNFLVVGDWGRDGAHYQRQVAGHMAVAARTSRFVVTTGDNFYTLGVSHANGSRWRSSFEDIYYRDYPTLQKTWFPVLGNHDYGGNIHAQIERRHFDSFWQMRGRWYDVPGTELQRPDVHLFFIDTVVWKGRENLPFNLSGSHIPPGYREAQKSWLARRLRESCARIKLVFGHHPIYSVGPHGGQMDMADLDRVLREGGVTAYICGHDHCLYSISRAGMHYICSGGGSEELTRFTGDPNVPNCVITGRCSDLGAPQSPNPMWHTFLPRAGFAAFSVLEDRVDYRFIDRGGTTYPIETCRPPRRPLCGAGSAVAGALVGDRA